VASPPCLRLRDALARAGVLVVVPDDTEGEAAVTEDDAEACGCCGIVLCCFKGELFADEGFFGEFIDWVVEGLPEGLVTEGGALEYNVTAGVGATLLTLLCIAKGFEERLGLTPLIMLAWGGGMKGCNSRIFMANLLSASITICC
jgi:hypothetical protein